MNSSMILTGANGGVGGMILSHLLKKGHRNIFCQYRSKNENLNKTLQSYDLNPEIYSVRADLKDESDIKKMGDRLREKAGFIGRVINVAGASKNGMSWKTSRADFMSVIEDNLLTSFLCSKEFIPDMREKKFGRIINFSSIVGSTGVAGAASYCAAKAALVGLTKSMGKELASRNITVNAIALGYFNGGLIADIPEDMKTEIMNSIPMRRFGNAEDIGSLVEYIIADESQYFTGQVVHLNGGQL